MKHVHAEVIKAWADGALVQARANGGVLWKDEPNPGWWPWLQFRIKPKDDVVMEKHVVLFKEPTGLRMMTPCHAAQANMRLTFDGETGALKKAEVI